MKKAKLLAMILVLYVTSIAGWPAQAWEAEEWYYTLADLPVSILTALPEQMTYSIGIRGEDTVSLMLNERDGSCRIYIFRKEENGYQLECKSASLADWYGFKAGIGFSGNMLHLIYDGGGVYFDFERTHIGIWVLRSFFAGDSFSINSLGLHRFNTGQHLYGIVSNTNLATLDTAKLPASIEDAFALVNTDGWAVVKSDVSTDRLHLRTGPSTNAESIGRYYSGTPVHILEDQGEWAKVSIGGIQGYMMKKYLAYGKDMLNVAQCFPSKFLTEEASEKGVSVYAGPDTNSTSLGTLYGGSGLAQYILANVDDDWYHVLCDDGLSGYVETFHFWEGLG